MKIISTYHRLVCRFCTFMKPNCMCCIGTRVSNDNDNEADRVSRTGN